MRAFLETERLVPRACTGCPRPDHQGLHRPVTVNTRSRRVMEKSGLTFLRTFTSDWPKPTEGSEQGEVGYELTRTAWERTVLGDTAGERCR